MRLIWASVCLVAMVWCVLPSVALAGIPECGGIRLEDVTSCELQGNVQCSAECSRLGIYKKACATKLHTVCRDQCTLSPEITCTDECTGKCQQQCDQGINITCKNNCYGECSGSCDTTCLGSADNAQCMAECEATCDGECDIRCAPVVEASCYKHCIECCGGSCGAQANMDCQTTCQDQEFEQCENELEIDCMGSCTGDGALFCDGKYVLSGSDLETCVNALIARGIGGDLSAQASLTFGGEGSANGCSVSGTRAHDSGLGVLALLGIVAWVSRPTRRRRSAR